MRLLLAMLLLAALPSLCCASPATVTINPAAPGRAVTSRILGMNMANWFNQANPAIPPALASAGIVSTRWPGGSTSDLFHWQTNTECGGNVPATNFTHFLHHVVQPGALSLTITLNYGSNPACSAGADPSEAGAWVAYAKARHDRVRYWTVGNEVYGGWEYDLHATPHDAATYAGQVANGFYPAIKQADPKAQVGVVVDPGFHPAWDPTVLSTARYDYVEYHFYAQDAGEEDDTYLLNKAPQAFTRQIKALQAELRSAGRPHTDIDVGEIGSVSARPGKQTTSITQALYAGEILGEMMQDGIARATWWLGFGGCSDATTGNFSASLYGWQNFGGYMVWSDGTPEWSCPNATAVPTGTPLPTARAYQLFSLVARTGEHVLPVTLSGHTGKLRAYALTHGSGTAIVLFNLNQTDSLPVTIAINGLVAASQVLVDTYDKSTYDQSQNNIWSAPNSSSLPATALPLTITLTPWSMTVLRIGS